jgi:hypothetical protein
LRAGTHRAVPDRINCGPPKADSFGVESRRTEDRTTRGTGRRTDCRTDATGAARPATGSAADLAALLRHDTAPWRRARPVLLALVLVVGAGSLLGLLAYHLAGGGQGWPTTVVRTASGWSVGSPDGLLQQSGLALTDDYLAWDNGDCLELLDLHSGKAKVLEYPPADGTAGVWAVISERYVAWQTNGRPDRGTEIVAYDLKTRRRFVVANTGDLGGAIALSGTTLYWECDTSTAADLSRGLIRARDLASGRGFTVATGDIQLGDVCGDLVMWTQSQGMQASAQLTVVKDLISGRTWRLRLCPKDCQTNGCSLSRRTLVWDVERDDDGTFVDRIEALDLDSGARRVVAQGKVFLDTAHGGRIVWTVKSGGLAVESAAGGPIRFLPAGLRFNEDPAVSATMIAGEVDVPAHVEIMKLAP